MMESLFFFKIKSQIDLTKLKIKHSREEIEVKHPKRTDYITSMKESEEDLLEIKMAWSIVTDEMKNMGRRLHSLETQNIEMIGKIAELKKINEVMSENLNL
tara:strand:+ start:4503 stop:4805 length:303 start_codon:yes stop_codon:yes gene_type:complete